MTKGSPRLCACRGAVGIYHDLPLGFVDASVIALAERTESDSLLTTDRRDFSVVRPRHVERFRLLP